MSIINLEEIASTRPTVVKSPQGDSALPANSILTSNAYTCESDIQSQYVTSYDMGLAKPR
jgi:hypothetical protein